MEDKRTDRKDVAGPGICAPAEKSGKNRESGLNRKSGRSERRQNGGSPKNERSGKSQRRGKSLERGAVSGLNEKNRKRERSAPGVRNALSARNDDRIMVAPGRVNRYLRQREQAFRDLSLDLELLEFRLMKTEEEVRRLREESGNPGCTGREVREAGA